MTYVVVGARGMLGTELVAELAGRDVRALGRDDLDITDRTQVRRAIGDAEVVINAAAYTRVDDAETDEAAAFAVNADAPGVMAEIAAESGARFVQVSTDYVFRGDAATPYPEDAPLDPVSAYGRSKAAGEHNVTRAHPGAHIVRTAWLYGAHGSSFPRTILRLAAERPTLQVVADQIGQPTWARDVARSIIELLDVHAPAGVYHATSAGQASWFEFARAVFEEAGLDPARVEPTDSSAFVRPAPRPAFSVLGHARWGQVGLPPRREWREALTAAASTGALGTI